MSSKKLRHNEKKALRKNQFLEFGEGNRGASREMRRNPEKYGMANNTAKDLIGKGLI